ncbi:tricarballylate utilization 4Fe-4S protein TcuB [Marinivivus vitaminiproducens]|uniref:tricarballylate utilization 4Fe-4S protein TcuB n=1 Tax=Marinivivus vitaminiproducens TaxID=3035935 RepID=UPI0027A4178E|nr:tricarballylate utilization 4Fe-4S protein TcuB [Geminicoccaceae bacterium SCSIO 64248]
MALIDTVREAERLMTICNACRYCEGHCAVFPAMEMRLAFTEGDLSYLANLCHNCGACYAHCQYAPPHEFAVNVPVTLAELRAQSYQDYTWPPQMAGVFERNGLAVSLVTAASLSLFLLATALLVDPAVLFAVHADGDFYRIIPHDVMAGLFTAVSAYVVVAFAMGFRRFWQQTGESYASFGRPRPFLQAMRDSLTLRYLDGGAGDGCTYPTEAPSQSRRVYHHLTFYGFMLCFAATSAGTIYHYVFGWQAPYGYLSVPVVLGTTGGIGLLIGPAGLLWLKHKADPDAFGHGRRGMDTGFLALLFLTSLSGLLLLVLRETSAMGVLLAVHLGIVLGLFLTLPYGKFVHAIYRFAALVRYALERSRAAERPEA